MHSNPLGSTGMLTDQTAGAPLQDELYYPWGQRWALAGTAWDERFAGLEERDPQVGFDRSATREYPSNQGRWLSPDPEDAGANDSEPQTWNADSYARKDPTTLTDR